MVGISRAGISDNKKVAFIKNEYNLQLSAVPYNSDPLVWLFIFRYIPMYGVQIAFRNFQATKGITGSEWVGLEHFNKFFNHYMFKKVVKILLHSAFINYWQASFSYSTGACSK